MIVRRRWLPGLSRWRISSVPIDFLYNVFSRALLSVSGIGHRTGRTRAAAILTRRLTVTNGYIVQDPKVQGPGRLPPLLSSRIAFSSLLLLHLRSSALTCYHQLVSCVIDYPLASTECGMSAKLDIPFFGGPFPIACLNVVSINLTRSFSSNNHPAPSLLSASE
jgi:hypothetical protein